MMKTIRARLKSKVSMRATATASVIAVIFGGVYLIAANFADIAVILWKMLSELTAAFTPLFIGTVIAYVLSPLADTIASKLETKFSSLTGSDPIKNEIIRNRLRLLGIGVSMLIVFAGIGALIYGSASLILRQVVLGNLSDAIPSLVNAFEDFQQSLTKWASHFAGGLFSQNAELLLDKGMRMFDISGLISFAGTKHVAATVIDVVLGIFIAFYLMKDKHFFIGLMRKFMHVMLPQRINGEISEALGKINDVLSSFLRGTLLDATLVAALSVAALSATGIDYAAFIGIFAGIANIVPYLGPILGMIPAFISGMLTDGPVLGIVAVLVLIIIQQLDTNIIYPRVVGGATGLHPATVLLAVSVFGYFWGIAGMILAVPLAGILQIFIVEAVMRRSRKKALLNSEKRRP